MIDQQLIKLYNNYFNKTFNILIIINNFFGVCDTDCLPIDVRQNKQNNNAR